VKKRFMSVVAVGPSWRHRGGQRFVPKKQGFSSYLDNIIPSLFLFLLISILSSLYFLFYAQPLVLETSHV